MKRKLFGLTIFAIAMAYLETVIVVYLRELYYPDNILVIFPPKPFRMFDYIIELGREAATVIMLVSAAYITERKTFTRWFAAFVYLFGLWDIFYYIWLKATIGWPVAWMEWDILFLIPWAWYGPWICPVLIASLFVIWGFRILCFQTPIKLGAKYWLLFSGGAFLVLYTFLEPAFTVYSQSGLEGIYQFTPSRFAWWLFIPGYLGMIAGLFSPILTGSTPLPADQ